MKNASQIISDIKYSSNFSKKLTQQDCINRVKKMFTPRLQDLLKYGYIHNHTMYFVFTHPGAKQEFDIILQSIKAPLKELLNQVCPDIHVKELRAYAKFFPPAKTAPKPKFCYRERSNATFSNPVKDQKLHGIIEAIRKEIDARNNP